MISPYAAPTDSRLSRIETSEIPTDRNAISSSTKASPATRASTTGVRSCSWWVKSYSLAVSPVTA